MRRLMTLILALVLMAPAPAAAQTDTGEIYRQGMELYRAGKYREALPLFQKALDLAEARYGEESPLLSLDLNNLAEIYRLLGQPDEAEPLYKRAIRLDEAAGGDNPGLATSLNNLALLYRSQGRIKEAEPLYKRALSILEKAVGSNHPDVARSLNNLAVLYRLQGSADKARPLQERAVAIAERALGPEHPTSKLLRQNLEVFGGPEPAAQVAEVVPEAPLPTPPAKAGLVLPNPNGALPPPGADRRAVVPAPSQPPSATPPAATTSRASPGAPRPEAPTPSRLAPSPATAGTWAVHLTSVRDPNEVAGEWRRLIKLHPMLADLPLRRPERIDVAGKGTFYRVAGGSFETHAEAQAFCNRLRAQNVYCTLSNPP